MNCKFCGSTRTTKYGVKAGTQYYRCNDCQRKFAGRLAPEGMRFTTATIGEALALYYDGLSLTNIARHLVATEGTHVDPASIWRWIVGYSKKAGGLLSQIKVKTSPLWVIVQTVVKIRGENVWLWDVIDSETRFMFATHVSLARGLPSAIASLREGEIRAIGIPREIGSDGLAPYPAAVEHVFGADSTHIKARDSTAVTTTNLIKTFQSKVKERTKVLRRLKSIDAACIITEGFIVHYNFIFPHTSLKGTTPAIAAGLSLPFRTWRELVDYLGKITPQMQKTANH